MRSQKREASSQRSQKAEEARSKGSPEVRRPKARYGRSQRTKAGLPRLRRLQFSGLLFVAIAVPMALEKEVSRLLDRYSAAILTSIIS
jgi:hypothetical protein